MFNSLKMVPALISHSRYRRLNRDFIGYRLEETLAPLNADDFREFARATEDHAFFEGSDRQAAPPLYMAKLVMPMLKRICLDKRLRLNLLRLVHAGQSIRWHRPLNAGAIVRLRVTVSDIQDTRAGEMITVSGRAFVEDGLAAEGHIGMIIRTHQQASRRKTPPAQWPQGGFRLPVLPREGQQYRYAAVSGDDNPIHTSAVIARMAGLPRTIMHGACMLAMYCSKLSRHMLVDDVDRLAAIGGRFARPVLPGQPLDLVGHSSDTVKEVRFSVLDAKNRPVFRSGRFVYR